jgi:carboxypeptidase PM20D1
MLVASGFQPRRTVYLVLRRRRGGRRPAWRRSAIAELLKQRGVKLDFVIDEGLLITEGVMPG